MGVWAWLRPGDRIWKVVSDYEKGTICVYDEKGNVILEKKGLTKAAVEMVEKSFLNVTATNLDGGTHNEDRTISDEQNTTEENPMYA